MGVGGVSGKWSTSIDQWELPHSLLGAECLHKVVPEIASADGGETRERSILVGLLDDAVFGSTGATAIDTATAIIT